MSDPPNGRPGFFGPPLTAHQIEGIACGAGLMGLAWLIVDNWDLTVRTVTSTKFLSVLGILAVLGILRATFGGSGRGGN